MREERDAMLVAACLAGDTTAFAELVDAYQSKLFYAAYRVTGSTEDAMDATQSAFVKAYENLHTFDPSRRFFSWIYRIALNEALNIVDRRRSRSESEIEEDFPGRSEDPADSCQAGETGRCIQWALLRLDGKHRVVITLRYFHGLSYQEIAEVVGVSEKRVKSRLFEARKLLRTILAERGFFQ